MEALGDVAELKQFIQRCESNPEILNHPSLHFFTSYLQSLGARTPQTHKTDASGADASSSRKKSSADDGLDDEIVESDIDLDNSDVVEPDNDSLQKMGDTSIEVTEEMRDAAQMAKSKAVDAISEGNVDEALDQLTEAIMLNPTSAILYATRGSVFVKLKKPNAAIRDANAALQINPDAAKAYKVRGMARALMGLWEEAASDLHVASLIDYDEETGSILKKVEPNARKIGDHRKKYERLRKERESKRAEHGKQHKKAGQEQEALSALKDGQVISIHSTRELEKKLNATKRISRLAILYFTATWCGPCRIIGPVFTSLAEKYPKVVFLKVDIDDARDVAMGYNISSVPTFFYIKDGKEVDKVEGADKFALENKITVYAP